MSAATQHPTLRIGTRTSPLALAQTTAIVALLAQADIDAAVELVPIVSSGDTDMRDLSVINERGIFASALEQALLAGTIDAAVHSCKDLALDDTPGLVIAAVPMREDPRDVLCGPATSVAELPTGARISTGSARRSSALRTLRDDLVPAPIRGNVATRLATSESRGDDACMLAAAGLNRLGLRASAGGFALAVDEVVPEAGQGIVVVQTRAGDDTIDWTRIDDPVVRWSMDVERAIAAALGGGCETPVGVHVSANTVGANGSVPVYVFTAPRSDAPGTVLAGHAPLNGSVDGIVDTTVEMVRRSATVISGGSQ